MMTALTINIVVVIIIIFTLGIYSRGRFKNCTMWLVADIIIIIIILLTVSARTAVRCAARRDIVLPCTTRYLGIATRHCVTT